MSLDVDEKIIIFENKEQCVKHNNIVQKRNLKVNNMDKNEFYEFGYNVGFDKGFAAAIKHMNNNGYNKGYNQGYKKGYKTGKKIAKIKLGYGDNKIGKKIGKIKLGYDHNGDNDGYKTV